MCLNTNQTREKEEEEVLQCSIRWVGYVTVSFLTLTDNISLLETKIQSTEENLIHYLKLLQQHTVSRIVSGPQ